MMKSAIYPNHEAVEYSDYSFDPQADFFQFLEEARQHRKAENFQCATPNQKAKGSISLGEEKKSKKSWKSFLVSWWKADKKNKKSTESKRNFTNVHNSKKGYFSGPIYNSGSEVEKRQLRSTSGPLRSNFNSTQRVENEIPYVLLDQPHVSSPSKGYGPVYLVT